MAYLFVVPGLIGTMWLYWRVLWHRPSDRAPKFAPQILLAGLAVSVAFGLGDDHLIAYPHGSWRPVRFCLAAELPLLATYALGYAHLESRWVRDARFVAFAVLILIGGIVTIRASSRPAIDVWTFQQSGASALLAGKNPFVVVAEKDTGPANYGLIPYLYPPLQLLLTVPGFILGDVRYTMLLAVLAAGIALRRIVRCSGTESAGFTEDLPTLALWLSPKLFFVLEQSWVDSVQLALICVATLLALRGRRTASAIFFGLVFCAKQTMFWMLPLVTIFVRWRLKHWLLALGTAAVVCVPFALWDWHALKHANFDFLVALPAREDGLTISNFFNRTFHTKFTGAAGFPLAAVVVAFAIFRARKSVAKFGVATLATYTVFFLFNKGAFANYYFFLGGLAALAAAVSTHELPSRNEPECSPPISPGTANTSG